MVIGLMHAIGTLHRWQFGRLGFSGNTGPLQRAEIGIIGKHQGCQPASFPQRRQMPGPVIDGAHVDRTVFPRTWFNLTVIGHARAPWLATPRGLQVRDQDQWDQRMDQGIDGGRFTCMSKTAIETTTSPTN